MLQDPLFQTFLNTLSEPRAIIKADTPHFTMLACNEHYRFVSHTAGQDIIGKSIKEIYAPDGINAEGAKIIGQALNKAVDTNAPVYLPAVRYDIPSADKSAIEPSWWQAEYAPILGDDGKTAYIMATIRNITEQMFGQDAIEQLRDKEEALQKEQALSEQLALLNQKLSITNQELKQSQQHLLELNNELEQRVAQRTHAAIQSELKFRSMIAQAPVAIATFRGPEFVIDHFNDMMLEYWGRPADEVKNIPLFTAMPETSGQGYEELLTNVLLTGERFIANELPLTLLRNGKLMTIWTNFTYDPLRDMGGNVTGILVVCTEVTDQVTNRKHLEQTVAEKTELEHTLRQNEQRLQGILDTMAEGVGIIDVTGRMIYANLMAQRILQLDADGIKERTFNDPRWSNMRLDGSPLPDAEHPMAVMMNTGVAVYDQEIALQGVNGECVYISINAAPIFDTKRQLTGGIATFMDVTNRRRLMQQKEEFISIASHELKTPLTSLKASLQLLDRMKHNPSPAIATKMIEQANKSLSKLTSLVNDLLNTNRITAGQLQLRKTEFTIAAMLNDCCNHMSGNGTHEIIIQGDLNLKVYADEQRIDQVMVNMVNNAVKYAPASKHIIIYIEQAGSMAKISVKDHGPGIPADKLQHLFNRYYRADYSGIQFSGLGLGLYISAEIIKRHGGQIGVNSELDKGSTFWVTLPLTEPA